MGGCKNSELNTNDLVIADIHLLKQHTPVSSAVIEKLDVAAFGYFDGIKFGVLEDDILNYFENDVLHLFTYDGLMGRHMLDKPDLSGFLNCSKEDRLPYCAIIMVQILPFCINRVQQRESRGLLQEVCDEVENAIKRAKTTYDSLYYDNPPSAMHSSPSIRFYPYCCMNQIDIVIAINSNSITYITDVIEHFMHENRYREECFNTQEPVGGCGKLFCNVSSYSVCGVLTHYKGNCIKDDHGFDMLFETISDYDIDNNRHIFLYQTYVLNRADTMHHLPLDGQGPFCTLGNSDYVYLSAPASKNEFRKFLKLVLDYCGATDHIAGAELMLLTKAGGSGERCNHNPEHSKTCNGANSGKNRALPSNRLFSDLAAKITELISGNENGDGAIERTAKIIDEMYRYCEHLQASHYAPGVGVMLRPVFENLYLLLYTQMLLIRKSTETDLMDLSAPVFELINIKSLRLFIENMYMLLSCLALSTSNFAETQDFRSNELNGYSKYLIGYYVCIKQLLKELKTKNMTHKKIEVLTSISQGDIMQNELLFSNINSKFSLYVLPLPIVFLNKPYMLVPLILHEVGHMIEEKPREKRKELMIKAAARYITAFLVPKLFRVTHDPDGDLFEKLDLPFRFSVVDETMSGVNVYYRSTVTQMLSSAPLKREMGDMNRVCRDEACTAVNEIIELAACELNNSFLRVFEGDDYYFNHMATNLPPMVEQMHYGLIRGEHRGSFGHDTASWLNRYIDGRTSSNNKDAAPGSGSGLDLNKVAFFESEAYKKIMKRFRKIIGDENLSFSFIDLEQRLNESYGARLVSIYRNNAIENMCGNQTLKNTTASAFTAFKEVYPDVFMLAALGIHPPEAGASAADKHRGASKYMDSFGVNTIKRIRNSLGASLRICAILSQYFNISGWEEAESFFDEYAKNGERESYRWITEICYNKPNERAKHLGFDNTILPPLCEYTQACIEQLSGIRFSSDVVLADLYQSVKRHEYENIFYLWNSLYYLAD